VGYRLDALPEPPPVFGLIAERGGVEPAELYEVFNMGCGFCCVVPAGDADAAVSLLAAHHPGAAVVGEVTASPGIVELPAQGLVATKDAGFAAA
jgi:phosphoribosylformylglycinamidine cyclo-ligase